VVREDLNHPVVSGNKWWKLKYNLIRARELGADTLLTMGGAYSNHIHAVAGAAHELGFRSIGMIRGEETLPLNPTLQFAVDRGMQLHYVSRTAYKSRSTPAFIDQLHMRFGEFYFIPEGGTNELAIQGCVEFGDKLVREVDFDVLCLPVGTGGTMAGIVQALRPHQQAIGFSVLKDGGFLEAEVRKWLKSMVASSWRMETRFHFGGYAKTTKELDSFLDFQETSNRLPLDPVYTSKTLYGIFELVRSGEIPRGSTVLMIHTGGLQGRSPNRKDPATPR
jgi:1-aminocyclopropane-1-carboxylate deaminase